MEYLVSGKEMKRIDQNTSSLFHVPELVLMEQAAMSFVSEYEKNYGKKSVGIVCGCGNNGGDGLAIARLFNQHEIPATVFMCSEFFHQQEKETESFRTQKKIYRSYAFPEAETIDELSGCPVLLDAVFGVGLHSSIKGEYEGIIEKMNEYASYKIAVDIPSGVIADSGDTPGIAFRADETYTFAFNKIGNVLWPGCDYAGKTTVLWIGITRESFGQIPPKYGVLYPEDLQRLPVRKEHSNKGTFGKVLIIAGQKDMAGAACLASRAAYKAGAGLVKAMAATDNKNCILSQLPEVLFQGLDEADFLEERFLQDILWADSVVVGPGMGVSKFTYQIVRLLLTNLKVPLVLDADALNVLENHLELLEQDHGDVIITPHLKEMSRLTQCPVSSIQKNLIEVAEDFANQYGVITVLKDFKTVIAVPYGMTYINVIGSNGMATGGSGDVLSGIIGSMTVNVKPLSELVAMSVLIHGLSGAMISEHTGCHGMMAGDIINGLNLVWNQVENNVKE